jgi:hypothetical protein
MTQCDPVFAEHRFDPFRIDRLLDERHRPELLHAFLGERLNVGGHHDHETVEAFLLQVLQHLVAIHDRHRQIQEHDVGPARAVRVEGLLAVGRLGDVHVPGRRQRLDQHLARHRGIVNYEYGCSHDGSESCFLRTACFSKRTAHPLARHSSFSRDRIGLRRVRVSHG